MKFYTVSFRMVSLKNLLTRPQVFLYCSLRQVAREAVANNHSYCMDVLDFDNCCHAAAQQFETMYGYKLRLSTDLFVCSYFSPQFLTQRHVAFLKNKTLNEAS